MYTVNQVTIVPRGEVTFQQICCENIVGKIIDLCNDLFQNNYIGHNGVVFSTIESSSEIKYSTIVCRNKFNCDKLIIFFGHEYDIKDFLPRVYEINMDSYEENMVNKLNFYITKKFKSYNKKSTDEFLFNTTNKYFKEFCYDNFSGTKLYMNRFIKNKIDFAVLMAYTENCITQIWCGTLKEIMEIQKNFVDSQKLGITVTQNNHEFSLDVTKNA